METLFTKNLYLRFVLQNGLFFSIQKSFVKTSEDTLAFIFSFSTPDVSVRILRSLPEIRYKTAVSTITSTVDKCSRDRSKSRNEETKSRSHSRRESSSKGKKLQHNLHHNCVRFSVIFMHKTWSLLSPQPPFTISFVCFNWCLSIIRDLGNFLRVLAAFSINDTVSVTLQSMAFEWVPL